MTLETAIQNLADAINSLANAGRATTPAHIALKSQVETPAEPAKRGPGRPRKAEAEADADAETPEPASAPEAPVAPPEPAPPPKRAATAAAGMDATEAPVEAPDKNQVRAVLIEVVKRIDKETCAGLCERYGAPMLSGIDPSNYAALMADAQVLLRNLEPA